MAVMLDTPWAGTNYNPASALDIATLEAALVSALTTTVGRLIEVGHYPDNPETYRLTHRVGAALVQYAGSEYGEIETVDVITQERTLEFGIVVKMRDLGWAYGGPASGTSPGAYQILELIRQGLTGYRLVPDVAATKLRPARERFLKREDGIWEYEIYFSTRTVAVENYTPPNYPLFVTGLAFEENGQTIRTVAAVNYTFANGIITLPNQNLSAVVVKSLSGQVYLAGPDYTVNNVTGVITWISGGGIPAGATVSITYNYADIVKAVATGGAVPFNPSN